MSNYIGNHSSKQNNTGYEVHKIRLGDVTGIVIPNI